MADNEQKGTQGASPQKEKPSADAEGNPQPRAGTSAQHSNIGKAGRRLKPLIKDIRIWAGTVTTAVVIAVTTTWANHAAGPPQSTPSTPATGRTGHVPGSQDVSTLADGRTFYATPNYYEDQGCGRPCPIFSFASATESYAAVSSRWPCEYYDPASKAWGPFCLSPPSGRTKNEMANAAQPDSGDRILVVCQVNGQTIKNDAGQTTSVWDVVAMPAAHIANAVLEAHKLREVPRMPGFYETYVSDMWLGNTGWHHIPCAQTQTRQ